MEDEARLPAWAFGVETPKRRKNRENREREGGQGWGRGGVERGVRACVCVCEKEIDMLDRHTGAQVARCQGIAGGRRA